LALLASLAVLFIQSDFAVLLGRLGGELSGGKAPTVQALEFDFRTS